MGVVYGAILIDAAGEGTLVQGQGSSAGIEGELKGKRGGWVGKASYTMGRE